MEGMHQKTVHYADELDSSRDFLHRVTSEDWIFQPGDGKWRTFRHSMQEAPLSKHKKPERAGCAKHHK